MPELSSLFMTHQLNVIFHTVEELWPGHRLLYATKQRKIIQKQKMQELPSLFMAHRINVMHALVKFHEYIPYSLGVKARTRLTIWNLVKGK